MADHDHDTCPWKQLADELMEDNRQLMEWQQEHINYLKGEVAEGALRHGDPDPALNYLAQTDPHNYLDLPGGSEYA